MNKLNEENRENYKKRKEQLRKTLCFVACFGIPVTCYQVAKFIQKQWKWVAFGQIVGVSVLFFYKHYRFWKRVCLCHQQNFKFTSKCNSECIIINHMPLYKQIQMRWSQLWGVDWFKKYWIKEGAVWNDPSRKNINPIQQCQRIIEKTHGFQNEHYTLICVDLCCIFFLVFSGREKRVALMYLRYSLFLHSYAFILHFYNLSLAETRMSLLQKLKKLKK